jgi:hypothetical protein
MTQENKARGIEGGGSITSRRVDELDADDGAADEVLRGHVEEVEPEGPGRPPAAGAQPVAGQLGRPAGGQDCREECLAEKNNDGLDRETDANPREDSPSLETETPETLQTLESLDSVGFVGCCTRVAAGPVLLLPRAVVVAPPLLYNVRLFVLSVAGEEAVGVVQGGQQESKGWHLAAHAVCGPLLAA